MYIFLAHKTLSSKAPYYREQHRSAGVGWGRAVPAVKNAANPDAPGGAPTIDLELDEHCAMPAGMAVGPQGQLPAGPLGQILQFFGQIFADGQNANHRNAMDVIQTMGQHQHNTTSMLCRSITNAMTGRPNFPPPAFPAPFGSTAGYAQPFAQSFGSSQSSMARIINLQYIQRCSIYR